VHQNKILDALESAPDDELMALADGDLPDSPAWEIDAAKAELARREAES
jgi:hypothetical protein